MNSYFAQITRETIPTIFPAAGKIYSISGIVAFLVPLSIIGAVGVLLVMMIMGAFNFITSSGDPEKTKKAQQTLTYGILGFFIVFASVLIVRIITTVLKVKENLPF